MLKAVLFDDEHIVLKGLQKLIVWSECGVELVATAQNGKSALAAIRHHQPDIVLTDIRMPGIDGLELIRTIGVEFPDTVCIVFSGYNEYEYVKTAIHLGVIDYLEKPITLEKIREAIHKAVQHINERLEMLELKKQKNQRLIEQSTMELLMKGQAAVPSWMEQFGPKASSVSAVTVLACSDGRYQINEDPSYEAISIRNGEEHTIVLFHFDMNCQNWMEQLKELTDVTVGSGNTYTSMKDASKSYKEAHHALRYGRYLEGNGWITFNELADLSEIQLNTTEKEEALLFELRLGNKKEFMIKLDLFLEQFKKRSIDPDVAEMEFLQLIFHCMEAAKETGGNAADIFSHSFVPQKELRNMKTRDDAAIWLRQQLEYIIDWVVGIRQKSKHAAIEKAIRYMEEHYGRDLTQQEVANHVNMNATYFSLLFKEQMELSYIKYLTKIRIEKAKLFLIEGLPIQEISERVGYYHARHFSEVFKKYVGLTPGQYRTKGNVK
ncbi:response regulator transcription factor [Paenibacillus camelliae]|uniref:response regulator transcription factor n=1 Tax=Paenibacillus camelliae TaxID=512410 RepID=UPI00203DAED1|nr:response regulator [Paenibacillus camelliae]MCM3632809.1 response regulator [Paenibacillus camelliae]